MSQKNQGNPASKKEGADRGKPGNTKSVSGMEKLGGSSGLRFPMVNHPEHCDVDTPKGKMDR